MALAYNSAACWRCTMRLAVPRQIPKQSARSIISTIQSSSRKASTVAAQKPKYKPADPPASPKAGKPEIARPPAGGVPPSVTKSIAKGLRSAAPSFTETYVAYGVCEELVKECVRVADYKIPQADDLSVEIPKNDKGEDIGVGDSWWYTKLGMTPTFNTWAQITFLHMYLLTVRLRGFEHSGTWNQHLTDHFFQLAEDRMVLLHRLNSRMIRNKYLKDLYVQWRGLNAAYDEGLVRGDAVLATAVWRNICKGSDQVDVEKLAEIVSYIRSVLASFDNMADEVIAQGDVVFGDPSSEEAIVRQKAFALEGAGKQEFTKAPAKVVVKK